MDVASETIDNLTLLLTQIVEFTGRRRQILTGNLLHHRREGFMPRDLPLEEFTRCMTLAVSEHLRSKRLLFQDSSHLRFRLGGQFEADPVVDEQGLLLLRTDVRQYRQYQLKKLSENRFNARMAQQLLMRKRRRSAVPTEKTAN
jgi:hypothetical protein